MAQDPVKKSAKLSPYALNHLLQLAKAIMQGHERTATDFHHKLEFVDIAYARYKLTNQDTDGVTLCKQRVSVA